MKIVYEKQPSKSNLIRFFNLFMTWKFKSCFNPSYELFIHESYKAGMYTISTYRMKLELELVIENWVCDDTSYLGVKKGFWGNFINIAKVLRENSSPY